MSIRKVLLVSGSARFSTRDVWDGYRIALQESGIDVIPYPTFSFLKVLSADSVCSDILGNALDVKNEVDCVIFVDGLYFRGDRSRIPLSIRRAGIPTVLIGTDDPYESIANTDSLYTWRFSNEIQCSGDGVDYLPTATLPLPQLPSEESPDYDLCFVGTVFEDRYPLLKELSDHCEVTGRRMLIAGKLLGDDNPFQGRTFTDVVHGTIETAQKLEYYTRSRVVLNLFRTSGKPAESPSPRVFEVTGLGQAALLTGPDRSEVRRIYGDTVYHFTDAASAIQCLEEALTNEDQRRAKVQQAREITNAAHLYHHRAQTMLAVIQKSQQADASETSGDEKTAWIIGCGRTGSTWLAELLSDLPHIRRWHEPYFGRFLKHLQDRPDDLDRPSSFFSRQYISVWMNGLRELFFRMVRERFPHFGNHALIVKEVNTPEIYPWLNQLFPAGRVIHLVRDPFDTLDSYLDLQQPGSWNAQFATDEPPLSETSVRRTAEHIKATMSAALRTWEQLPAERRLEVRYEDLLSDPVPSLQQCARLVGIEVTADQAQAAVDKHDFRKYRESGPGNFRRKGQAGVWQTSGYFTPEVTQIAQEILGPLRTRLGYSTAVQPQ